MSNRQNIKKREIELIVLSGREMSDSEEMEIVSLLFEWWRNDYDKRTLSARSIDSHSDSNGS